MKIDRQNERGYGYAGVSIGGIIAVVLAILLLMWLL
jgi:hypothetical protein